jgi:nicotinamidase/pyrazinamidase
MTAALRTHLLIIDPQNDFVDPNGALYVTRAEEDAQRLAHLINHSTVDAISVSLDSHHKIDISHPLWYFNADGKNPAPFTQINSEDLKNGTWKCADYAYERTLEYVQSLENNQRYPHVIWPEHCLIGSQGYAIYPLIFEALQQWTATQRASIEFIRKGENIWTEHFSAIEAEVPDENDPHTQVNQELINRLAQADQVWVTGWARSHCVGNTVRDLVRYGGSELAKKLVLVNDTMSDVTGFEQFGKDFVKEVILAGVQVQMVHQLLK